MVSTLNSFLAAGTVLLQAFSVFVLFSISKGSHAPRKLPWLVLAISTVATLFSLFYSNIANFTPCTLCWYQRILMYPQALIMALAIWKRDSAWPRYIMALSLIGGLIAIYNHYLQIGGNAFIPCGSGGACAKRFVFEFDYITIPLMSFTAFLTNGLLALWSFKKPAA